jgi:Leucine-rich repeat (LRR) protein|mmetsp:Transcript_1618/g.3544  ORF Transcript_1618/g.3544 Transcript_1618/m.3544 type:complete len:231 (-) Transcript_1618:139-831(-)
MHDDEPELVDLNLAAAVRPPTHMPTVLSTIADEVASSAVNNRQAECRLAVLAVLQGLSTLDLTEMGLGALPDGLGRLEPHVLNLDLSCNALTALPPVVCSLGSLVELQLFCNRLTHLPDCITSLVKLRRLLAVQNNLTALPAGIGRLVSLQELDLDENELTALPTELAHLPHLALVRADSNPLCSPPLEVVRRGIEDLRCFLRAEASVDERAGDDAREEVERSGRNTNSC